MYDDLYQQMADVEVVIHADHPTLNRAVHQLLADGERLDLISTHGKYAPSQAHWLHPLDDVIPATLLAPLAPKAVNLCRFRDRLLCLPRNIDVRVLWWRTDLLDDAPADWHDVVDAPGSFGFTVRHLRPPDPHRTGSGRCDRAPATPRRGGSPGPPRLALRRRRRRAARRASRDGRGMAGKLRTDPHL
jgi:hypothetical protein